MPQSNLEDLLLQNPNAPTNDDYALEFARRIYNRNGDASDADRNHRFDFTEGPADFEAGDSETTEWCGEATRGLLEAVMASDLLSSDARQQIESMEIDAAPSLERSKTIGHFRFRWTERSADARDNTNETNIDLTAVVLNDCWDRFTADFRRPKAALRGGTRIIDVDVYYDGGLHGSTSSHTNRIFLNAATVVNDECRRQTTSAHELFHRVQYSYGYITGTAGQRWWVEALGSWSQEYYAPDVDDYINRVNSGLANPGRPLLTRSYDACHYWKYLGEQVSRRSSAISAEHDAISEVLETYASNGLDAQAAAGSVTQSRLSRPFNRFFQDWSKANYLKDLNLPSLKYDYVEDENVTRCSSRTYGPYRHVAPVTDTTIADNATNWTSGNRAVDAFGTNYHHFDIDSDVGEFELRFDGNVGAGSGTYSVHIGLIRDNRWRRIYNYPSTTEMARNITFDPGSYDRCVVVVNGMDVGGSYELGLNDCVTGTWRDSFNFAWTLRQAGGDISGRVVTTGCGTYLVEGTLTGQRLVLKATGNCCDFTFDGTVSDCASVSGAWTNDCNGNGSFSMRKVDAQEAATLDTDESEEVADDPTTATS